MEILIGNCANIKIEMIYMPGNVPNLPLDLIRFCSGMTNIISFVQVKYTRITRQKVASWAYKGLTSNAQGNALYVGTVSIQLPRNVKLFENNEELWDHKPFQPGPNKPSYLLCSFSVARETGLCTSLCVWLQA